MVVLLLFACAVVAFGISTVAGGGAGLMLIPVLAIMLPAAQVPAALSIGTAASSLSRIALFRRSIRWDVVRWFLPMALPMAALGAWLLSRFDPLYVKLVLGLFLAANLPFLLLPRRVAPGLPRGRIRPAVLTLVGGAVGLLSGFTGAVGVAFNRFYFRLGLSKQEIVATRATNEVLLHALKIALYAALGMLTTRSLLGGGIVALAAVAAAYGMTFLIRHIDETLFRRAGEVARVVAGLGLLSSTAPAALRRNDAGMRLGTAAGERSLHAYWRTHRYGVAWTATDGIVLDKRLGLVDLKPRDRRILPPLPPGASIVAIDKLEALDREGLKIAYAQGPRRWATFVPTRDDEG